MNSSALNNVDTCIQETLKNLLTQNILISRRLFIFQIRMLKQRLTRSEEDSKQRMSNETSL